MKIPGVSTIKVKHDPDSKWFDLGEAKDVEVKGVWVAPPAYVEAIKEMGIEVTITDYATEDFKRAMIDCGLIKDPNDISSHAKVEVVEDQKQLPRHE